RDLLTKGKFTQNPVRLPFPLVDQSTVTRTARTDLEQLVDTPYEKVVGYFEDKARQKAGFEFLDPSVYPDAAGKKLKIVGAQRSADETIFRFTHPQLSRDIVLRLSPEGRRTSIIFENQVLTQLNSGVMPARVGFMPAGFPDARIPFRFN
ncbi:MAG: hypothetical protein AAGI01_10385, partial [Myxococcota bacterium]